MWGWRFGRRRSRDSGDILGRGRRRRLPSRNWLLCLLNNYRLDWRGWVVMAKTMAVVVGCWEELARPWWDEVANHHEIDTFAQEAWLFLKGLVGTTRAMVLDYVVVIVEIVYVESRRITHTQSMLPKLHVERTIPFVNINLSCDLLLTSDGSTEAWKIVQASDMIELRSVVCSISIGGPLALAMSNVCTVTQRGLRNVLVLPHLLCNIDDRTSRPPNILPCIMYPFSCVINWKAVKTAFHIHAAHTMYIWAGWCLLHTPLASHIELCNTAWCIKETRRTQWTPFPPSLDTLSPLESIQCASLKSWNISDNNTSKQNP